MVPVLNSLGKPLFPCKERRATALMKRRDAVPYWQKGIFHAYPADGQADAPRQPTSSLSFQPARPSGVGGAA